ncbi:DUF5362 family protein [Jejuia spongiicola]|uniref:DUF5362 family protein n=1 Tax=Jejuia spongiicola TaxID=2942207 RepID=A0ABT0QG79_9FLAO|nr:MULTISPECIES: DUF5362 family protein [Flavobacteriaceae]MCL6296009.1 DUF5362 family protein [Jejuia spongiicola]PIA80388.1 hypothetical protein BFR04_17160 [Gaetbulibacter sp. 4G1]
MEQKSAFDSFELEVSDEIKVLLKETTSWTYFLSILGFIGIGFLVIFGIFFGAIMSAGALRNNNPYEAMGFSMGYFGLIYVVMALIYFFPVLYLFNFSRKMKSALSNTNKADFKSAFTNLKSHYKFMGVFTIVIISIYVLAFIVGMFAAASF